MAAGWGGRLLRWIERLFLVAGAICLASVFVLWPHAAFYQVRAKREMGDVPAAIGAPRATPAPVSLESDGTSLIGLLDIPRLRLSVAAVEGDDDEVLRVAVGHVPGTPLPWEEGNSAFAGHRDMFFQPLKYLRPGDVVTLSTRHGNFRYRVRAILVVDPNETWALRPPDPAVSLTLVTCYPFTYVGLAPLRFIVHAERVSNDEH
jgi:sortase A